MPRNDQEVRLLIYPDVISFLNHKVNKSINHKVNNLPIFNLFITKLLLGTE